MMMQSSVYNYTYNCSKIELVKHELMMSNLEICLGKEAQTHLGLTVKEIHFLFIRLIGLL